MAVEAGAVYRQGSRVVGLPSLYRRGDVCEAVVDAGDIAAEWELGERLSWKKLLLYYADMMQTMLGEKLVKYVKRSEAGEIMAMHSD